ncbi:MAG TPA: calcium/sodium antiporter [Chitinispirillaceae bacterium]|nr:calcium/sodium antiporter [Chitinispirillaceae bacterium]
MAFLLLSIGLVLLYFGAEFLVKGSANLATRMGISSLVVGLTIVAFGTSAPELVVSIKAGFAGKGDIAMGNVVGSNIFNIAFILGLTALVRPVKVHLNVLRFDTPIMVACSVLLYLLLMDSRISRIEGVFLTVGIIAYTVVTMVVARKNGDAQVQIPLEELTPVPPVKLNPLVDVLLTIGGLVLLVFGSRFFVDGAIDIARILGVSEAVIGLTIVAGGTSLPELATSVIAAVKKESDIAIGNIVGSNIFNILAILGISGMINPLYSPGIDQISIYFMLGTSVLLIPFMWTGFKLSRIEGVIFLLIYGGYMVYLWPK